MGLGCAVGQDPAWGCAPRAAGMENPGAAAAPGAATDSPDTAGSGLGVKPE